jgi:hypothetical protein
MPVNEELVALPSQPAKAQPARRRGDEEKAKDEGEPKQREQHSLISR